MQAGVYFWQFHSAATVGQNWDVGVDFFWLYFYFHWWFGDWESARYEIYLSDCGVIVGSGDKRKTMYVYKLKQKSAHYLIIGLIL